MALVTSRATAPAVPDIDPSTCSVCGICTKICSSETLQLKDGAIQVVKDTAFGCIGCGQCMAVCPTGSIMVLGRCLSPEDLQPLPPPDDRATAGQLAALLQARRSVRNFTAEGVARELVEGILEMTAEAPMGIPPSEVGVVVFQGRDKVQAFAEDIAGLMKGGLGFLRSPVFKVMQLFMGKPARTAMTGFIIPLLQNITENREQGRDVLLYDAPLALLFHHSPYCDPADPQIAVTYAMLAAEALGLGTCLIGSVAPVLARDKAAMARCGLPEGNKPAIVLIAGHPRYKFKRAIKRSFQSLSYH